MTKTLELHPQYITDEEGQRRSVVPSVDEFEALVDRLEDALDIEFLRGARASATEFRSWKEIEAELEAEKRLRATM
ncbi:hypothetical protein IT575_14725 [bacterium]|nr:hypothetical protein [bacterium]